MLDFLTSLAGLFMFFGPLAAWLFCKKVPERIHNAPDKVGLVLVLIHPLLLSVWIAFYLLMQSRTPEWFAGMVGALAFLALEAYVWRRATRGTVCGRKVEEFIVGLKNRIKRGQG